MNVHIDRKEYRAMKTADIGTIKRNLYFRYLAMPLELEMSGGFLTFVTVVAVVSHKPWSP